jgi:hypothetical protein
VRHKFEVAPTSLQEKAHAHTLALLCRARNIRAEVSPLGTVNAADDDGIVKFKSAYDMAETIKRLKKDVADKGIMFFDEIDQAKLAADAGV